MGAKVVPFVLAVAALASSSDAAPPKIVVLGEVSAPVSGEQGVDYAALVRSAAEDELRALDVHRVHRARPVIVSVSLVRLETHVEPRTRATCVVSAVLRDARQGAVFAILEGKAQAMDGERRALEKSALQGAMHGALGRIPEALGD
jgi:hypothetical protein